MSLWRIGAIICLLLVMLTPRPGSAQTAIQYLYDDLGRLIAVVDANGDTAVYHYDAVGNLLSIDRHASSQVSIVSFSPSSGPVGTTVTISGTGFSSTPSQNAVTFNGTAASVTSATTTQLVVTVPSGATTGTIGVASPGGSATSPSAFTVTTGTGAPTITSFTPGTTVPGTSLTVNGTNFETAPSQDNLKLNIAPAQVTSATTTAIQTTVPSSAGTGHVTVATPNGTAITSSYLWVVPAPYGTSTVDSTGSLTLGIGSFVSVATANKIGLRAFDGTHGHRAFVDVTGIAGGTVTVALYNPFGAVLTSALMLGSGFLDTLTLAWTATYALAFDPSTTSTTSGTVTVYDVPADYSGSVTAGGSAVTVTTTTPGQNGVLTFAGTASQRISLKGTNGMSGQIAFACDVNVSILKPDSSVLASPACMEGSGFIDLTTLPTTGTYSISVDPVSRATGSLTLTLYDIPGDFSSTITPGGSAVTVAITTPGQNGSLTFSGTAGQRISLRSINGLSGQLLGCDVNVSVLKPDASVLIPTTCMEGSAFIDVTTLPTTGTYTIVVDPVTTAIGNLPLTLYSVPADFSGTITAGGSAVTVTTTTPGQNAALTFSGTANQRISLKGTNGMGGQLIGCDVNASILKPDSSVLASATCMEGTGFIDVKTLPTTGTYTIVVDPVSIVFGNLTLTLYDVPADPSTSVTIGGSSAALTTTTPGQNALATFSGTSGQQVTVRLTNNSMGSTTVKLLKPDGSQLTSATSSASSFNLATQTLPTTGTYTISIDPGGTNVGSITISVTSP